MDTWCVLVFLLEGGGDILCCVDGAGEGEEVVWVASAKGKFLEQAVGVMASAEEDDNSFSKEFVVQHEGYKV